MDSKRTNNNGKKRELVLKFLVIGDYGVGKTAIVRRYTEGTFSSNYKVTIGADFSVKTLRWDANTKISVQLWDIAGHEKFSYMTRVYYKYAIGCAVVFDVSRFASYQSVPKWLRDMREKVMLDEGGDVPVVLLANKSDIGDCCVPDETINKLCREYGFKNWFKTSAKKSLNIDEAINSLIEGALATMKPEQYKRDSVSSATDNSIALHEECSPNNDSTCRFNCY